MKLSVFVLVFVISALTEVHAQAGTSCVTPNGENARCISIYSCSVFLRALKNKTAANLRFLRESQCGYEIDPLVCCGSVAEPTQNTPPPVRVTRPPVTVIQQRSSLLPNRDVCGQQINDRILNGEVTDIGEFPWMALLEYRGRNGRSAGHSCGGMLISARYVLTAAHCVVGRIEREVGTLFRVRLGEYNTQTSVDCTRDQGFETCAAPHKDIGVEDAIAHPGYVDNSVSRYHDIALIRLAENVQFSEFIKPVCLPTEGERSAVGDGLFVAGWGITEKNVFSPIKLKLRVPLVSNQQCAATFSRAGVSLSNGQLCAGGEAGKDSCQGDSGGPLMRSFPEKNHVWIAEGIVSFGAKCGSKDIPGIYTRISEYIDWIRSNMRP